MLSVLEIYLIVYKEIWNNFNSHQGSMLRLDKNCDKNYNFS